MRCANSLISSSGTAYTTCSPTADAMPSTVSIARKNAPVTVALRAIRSSSLGGASTSERSASSVTRVASAARVWSTSVEASNVPAERRAASDAPAPYERPRFTRIS